MSGEWVRAVATVIAGSLAGGLTNTIAVWMLFHPQVPPKLGPWRLRFLHGAIPKNQARLASAIGRTVGHRLLSDRDLQEALQSPGFREAFDERVQAILHAPLHRAWGSLADHLSPGALRQIELMLEGIAAQVEESTLAWIQSPDFEKAITSRVDAIITPEAEAWLARLLESEAFPAAVDQALTGAAVRLLKPDQPLGELLPRAWGAAMERAIASYLPVAAHRLSQLLEDPEARVRVEHFLRDLLHQMLQDLKLHQRLVARLVMTEDTLNRMVDTIQSEGAEQLAQLLQEPALQASLARGIHAGIQELLQMPAPEILGRAEDPGVKEIRQHLTQWLVNLARLSIRGHPEGALLGAIPRARIAQGVIQMARSDAGSALVRETLRPWFLSLVHRPIGIPARWLGPDGDTRLSAAVREPLWVWLQEQVPPFLAHLDIRQRVENKVLSYPTQELESLVRRVTDRELRLIIRLGYLLGGIIGGLLVVIHRVLPGG
jgi:uncharacterized membrane protein YheB (UPF0754 family)